MSTTATLANLVDSHPLTSAPPETSSKWHHAKLVLRLLSSALALAVAVESIVLLPIPVPITSPLLPLTLVRPKVTVQLNGGCCLSCRLLTLVGCKAVACISWNGILLYTMRLQTAWISNALRVHIAIDILLWVIGLTATAMQMASLTIRTQESPDAGTWNEDWELTATLCPLV
ncbi:hypothetical protein BJ166DRAFT_496327 [Pestalotiopsis sp. NC0098]|nr:hypothetical protein BJ166DRAFT_496327 [Pestalotiopsis sp. NC0098]